MGLWMQPWNEEFFTLFSKAGSNVDAGHSVTDTALRSGFGSAETLRRAFIQHLGVSPRLPATIRS